MTERLINQVFEWLQGGRFLGLALLFLIIFSGFAREMVEAIELDIALANGPASWVPLILDVATALLVFGITAALIIRDAILMLGVKKGPEE